MKTENFPLDGVLIDPGKNEFRRVVWIKPDVIQI